MAAEMMMTMTDEDIVLAPPVRSMSDAAAGRQLAAEMLSASMGGGAALREERSPEELLEEKLITVEEYRQRIAASVPPPQPAAHQFSPTRPSNAGRASFRDEAEGAPRVAPVSIADHGREITFDEHEREVSSCSRAPAERRSNYLEPTPEPRLHLALPCVAHRSSGWP